MASFTSKANGNWSASGQTTWNEVGVPGAGDTASIAHAIMITADTTIGDGTASTVLSIGTASTGSLTIMGATFTIRGNSAIGYHDGSTTAYPKLTIQHSGGTPGGIEFDGNSGVAPVMTIEDNVLVTITGTSGARCFIRTKSGTAGLPGSIAGNGANYFPFNMVAQYFDLARLGSSSVYGLYAPSVSSSITSPSDSPFTWDNFTVDNCGVCPYVGVLGASVNFQLTNGVWTNAVGTVGGTLAASDVLADSTAPTTGTRLIHNCTWTDRTNFSSPGFITVTSCVFGDDFNGVSSGPTCASFDGNFVYRPAGSTAGELESCGGMSNNYYYNEDTLNAFVSLITCDTLSGGVTNVRYNVFENAAISANGYIDGIGIGEENTVVIPVNYIGNIFFSSGSGSSFRQAITAASPTNPTPPPIAPVCPNTIEHNTIITNGYTAIGQGPARVGALQLNCVPSVKANILVNLGSSTGAFCYENACTPVNNNVLDSAPANAFGANCYKGFTVSGAGFWSGVTGDTGHEDGTPYSSPMSGSTAPGAFSGALDLAANTDPMFADDSRTLATWDSVVQGGPGTAAHAIGLIQADTSLIKSSLLPWVRAGYTPTNVLLEAASYTGDTSTTDANGKPWLGAGPGIGAMSLASSAAFTLTAPGTAKGDCTVASGNFTVTPLAPQTVIVTPTDGGMGGTFTPTTLSWTSSATAKTFTYTPALIGNHSIAITNNASLGNPAPVSYLGMVQLGYSGTADSGNACPSFGGFDFYANGVWLPEFKRDISGDSVDSQSATYLSLSNFTSTPVHVDFRVTGAGTGVLGIPINVVPGTQALLPITYTTYSAISNAGSTVPLPPLGSYEGYGSPGPPSTDPTGDGHCLVAVRNETTGKIDTLYEFYAVYSTDGGSTFIARGGFKFNIATGAELPDNQSTAEAGGMTIMPPLLTYERVALVLAGLLPDLGHTIRMTLPSDASRYVWPGRNTANSGGPYPAGFPEGGRIRLSAAWMAVNRSSYSGQAGVIIDAMHKYGLVMADTTGTGGIFIEGVTDSRWDSDATTHGIFALQTIPLTAFEVVAFQAAWTWSGPSSGAIGAPQTFTIARNPINDGNYFQNIYLLANGVGTGLSGSPAALSDNPADGLPTQTFTFTSPSGGVYTITGGDGSNVWWLAVPLTFTAGSVASTPVPAGALIGL